MYKYFMLNMYIYVYIFSYEVISIWTMKPFKSYYVFIEQSIYCYMLVCSSVNQSSSNKIKMVVPENGVMCDNIMRGIEKDGGGIHLHNRKQKLKQKFDILKKLGEGSCGKVQLGICKETEQLVAIKTIRKRKIETEADLIRIRREIQIMSSVRHPNIIHIYEVFENREKIVLVMEYAAGGELYDFLSEKKVLTEEEARRIFRQIAIAIFYCHKHNICHRDLKLENILLDEQGNAKIADFGLSNVFNHKALLSTYCGSPLYASPEIVTGTPYHGPEVDCWSLGVLLYTLVYGTMPFDGSNFKRLVRQISQGEYYEPKKPSRASPLIAQMMTVNPNSRADIHKICSHEWLNEGFSEKQQCFFVAEEMASSTPVRLDLLLSLAPSAKETNNNLTLPDTQSNVGGNENGPIRSQSLGNISPSRISNVITEIPEKKPKKTKKRDRSVSRSKKQSQTTNKVEQDIKTLLPEQSSLPVANNADSEECCLAVANNAVPEESSLSIVNNAVLDKLSLPVVTNKISEEVQPVLEQNKGTERDIKPYGERGRRRSSRVLEAVEKLDLIESMSRNNIDQKRRSSLGSGSSNSSKKSITSNSSLTKHEPEFSLESTVGLNKLAECALKDEPLVCGIKVNKNDFKNLPDDLKKSLNAIRIIGDSISDNNNINAVPESKRKTSRAEIKLARPELPKSTINKEQKIDENETSDSNYKTEVKHFVQVPKQSRRAEVSIPISASTTGVSTSPLPPRPITRQSSQTREHIIPIRFESEDKSKAKPIQRTTSITSSTKTSGSNLSRQSTMESDSNSSIVSMGGEPIRKSPREVIIPIAVEGGGFVTPSENTISRISSSNDNIDEVGAPGGPGRCFTLRSTRRQKPLAKSLQPADSISSDEEDDSFEILTAENLFSTLLSRVRDLTNRLSTDESRSSDFPRSFFNHHRSIFDHQTPLRRLTETRSFNRAENAPWRRSFVSTTSPQKFQPTDGFSRDLDQNNINKNITPMKPPLYKQVLPRFIETNKELSKIPRHTLLCNITDSKERQNRVDRILEKYRRHTTSPVLSKLSRSISCQDKSSKMYDLTKAKTTTNSQYNNLKSNNIGARSVSPYAPVNHTDKTQTRQLNCNSYLPQSNSLKYPSGNRARSLSSTSITSSSPNVSKTLVKSNSTLDNSEDEISESSSTKTTVSKEGNQSSLIFPIDWAPNSRCEETVSDRIRRRSFYVKLT
ncbi:probable serine/threonine-protein kinase MARK-A isoform X2 [Daktulosphaira vitifoliae]|uniref:probable serine/threonine-protein kinase MARK-A isoform X2 n=1 Tax=Daktulosphaira vitifoliae TaxID=58002 RepID=UPI0021A989FE|nr:probable serine/threonine-protein kinase MARK-A isoform X2 [Daktulosphaira vitifoliae]